LLEFYPKKTGFQVVLHGISIFLLFLKNMKSSGSCCRISALSFLTVMMIILLIRCQQQGSPESFVNTEKLADPLPSWKAGTARETIISFVEETNDSSNQAFIPVKDRIVVFDNDGTLWSEQPYYFQLQFAFDRIKAMSPDHPEWKEDPVFSAVIQGDLNVVIESGIEGLIRLVMASHAGMTTDEFDQIVKNWIDTARHAETGRLYKEMVFQPMLEVLEYFRENGFKTYIVSGGGVDFMRAWSEEVYGIPPEQIIGSSIKMEFEIRQKDPVIVRQPEIEFINDKEGKPVGIEKSIGRKPVAAFGNSDGDLAMLQWTESGKGKRLMVYIHHTDSLREWAYDQNSHIGKLDKGLREASEKGWVVVDMKNDWNRIYPFQVD
jgi:hypothetical protein